MRQSRRATKEISQRERANFFGRDPNINRSQEIRSATERRNLFGRGSSKLQSAMEYLMTYGWAILIIAVVLGVLYYLGIFNGQNLSPRLQPGSCHVARTSAGVENFGVCAGLPEFVGQFDGTNSYVSVPPQPSLDTSGSVTVSAWASTSSSAPQAIAGTYHGNYYGYYIPINNHGFYFLVGGGPSTNYYTPYATQSFAANQWVMVTGVYNATSGTIYMYINGKLSSSATGVSAAPYSSQPFVMGKDPWDIYAPLDGSMANVQVYNASLSAAEIQALYMEGIGGAPIKPANVTGWWPLNGNAADYSGNNNNGQSVNVQYTNTWINSYSAP